MENAKKTPGYLLALAEAFMVSIIWGSSFLFVKMALPELGPLTIGGLRYFIGFLVLLPFVLRRGQPFALAGRTWLRLALIGLSTYTIGNGALFWALKFLPSTTVSFLMSTVTLLVLLGSILWLREAPSRQQTLGIFISLAGMALFFVSGLKPGEPLGLAILALGIVSFALSGLLGRDSARGQTVDTLTLTAWPLAIGGGLMLLIALPLEGFPRASLPTLGLVLWLATVNTALGYILYNHALRVLTAFEMNVMLNLSPLSTALLAWILLGERLSLPQWAGIFVVMAGVGMTQRRKQKAN